MQIEANTQPLPKPVALSFEKVNFLTVRTELLTILKDDHLTIAELTEHIELIIKRNTITVSKNQRNPSYYKPWFKSYLKIIKNNRDKLYKLSRKYTNNKYYKDNFLLKKKELSEAIAAEKARYFSKLINKNLNNPRLLWSTFREIMTGINGVWATAKRIILKTQDTFINDDPAVANHLNDFFVNIGDLLAKKLPHIEYIPPLNNFSNFTISSFEDTTPSEIANIINNLKSIGQTGDSCTSDVKIKY